MFATIIEIVAKKLVDILGDRAAQLTKKDKTRAASYEAYYALKRIEETFVTIADQLENALKYPEDPWTEQRIHETIRDFWVYCNFLANQLEKLKLAFGDMEGKLEIYDTIESAQSVRLFMGSDADVLRELFHYGDRPDLILEFAANGDRPPNLREMAANMVVASRDARTKIAAFIRKNYGIAEREDGR